MFLKDVLEITVGPNSTRISSDYSPGMFYTTMDVEDDLFQVEDKNSLDVKTKSESFLTKEGDLLISVNKEKACVVGRKNVGKCLTSSFLRLTYDPCVVDPWFICFYINESEQFRREKNLRTGMAGLKYLHITAEVIRQVEINLPDIDTQRKLGRLYKESLRQIYLYEMKKNLIEKNVNAIINQNIKKENH